jgi:hypothetical protein
MTEHAFVIGVPVGRLASLTRQPDGLELRAECWADVWSACPEFGVRIDCVTFENAYVAKAIFEAWGPHEDAPRRSQG